MSNAIADLGGAAHLSSIYPKVYEYRKARGAAIGKYREWVRYYLQQNSRGKGHGKAETSGDAVCTCYPRMSSHLGTNPRKIYSGTTSMRSERLHVEGDWMARITEILEAIS
ncbi:MAG: hypothetical protein WA555_07670 [Candidatus Sulfotelmatobacter sp.]